MSSNYIKLGSFVVVEMNWTGAAFVVHHAYGPCDEDEAQALIDEHKANLSEMRKKEPLLDKMWHVVALEPMDLR